MVPETAQARKMSVKGFTILELVVVIVIIAILGAIALPQYTRTVERSRQAEARINLGVIRGAQLRYFAEHYYYLYPGDWPDLDIDQPVGRYFTYDLPANSAWTATCVARAIRDPAFENPGFGAYTIDIAPSGAETKSAGAP